MRKKQEGEVLGGGASGEREREASCALGGREHSHEAEGEWRRWESGSPSDVSM